MTHIVIILMGLMGCVPAFAQSAAWTVTKTEWSAQDERNYSEFVRALGREKCYKVDECVRSKSNPYRNTDPVNRKFWSDCADWPYFLRAYFAWKNNLPFGYLNGVATYDAIEAKKNPPKLAPGEKAKPIDDRYSALGNYPTSRYSIVPAADPYDFFDEVNKMQNIISSAMMRVGPDYNGKIADDFYSPALVPGAIRPGTVIYDPNGHVAVVYDVKPDGTVLYFDAHPDNSITHGMFDAKFARSKPAQGSGFKNFRPLKVVGAQPQGWWQQVLVGGSIVLSRNAEIRDYANTQYYGAQPNPDGWSKGVFSIRGKIVDVYEYVRASLATVKINPVVEFQNALQELCNGLRDRRDSVEVATKNGIHRQSHPATLPSNIFGSSGDWETYSTPSRDIRLRVSFLEIQKSASARYQQYLAGDFSDMQYGGQNLKADLQQVFHNMNYNCPVNYTNSAGRVVNMSFEMAIRRLYLLSFDPYHCPERRWGATASEELRSCTDDADKTDWYNAEQRIRNYLQRDWSSNKDMKVSDLANVGAEKAANIDLRGWLQSLPEKGN